MSDDRILAFKILFLSPRQHLGFHRWSRIAASIWMEALSVALADRGASVRGLAAVRRQSSGTAEAGDERVFRRRTGGGRAG